MTTLVNEVPENGTDDQVLKKNGSGFDQYGWETILEVPSGGSTGQVLTKTATGYEWQDAGGGGVQIHQSLRYHLTNSNQTINYTVPSAMYSQVTVSRQGQASSPNVRQATAGTVIRGTRNSFGDSFIYFDGYNIDFAFGFQERFYMYIVTFKN